MCGEICCVPEMAKTRVRELCGEICCLLWWQHTCAGNVRGVFVVLQRWQNHMREMCGEICCVQKVAKTCAGNVRGICCVPKMAKTCAGTVRVNLLWFKVATHVCGECAGIFVVRQRLQKRVREMCREIFSVEKVAQNVCFKFMGECLGDSAEQTYSSWMSRTLGRDCKSLCFLTYCRTPHDAT